MSTEQGEGGEGKRREEKDRKEGRREREGMCPLMLSPGSASDNARYTVTMNYAANKNI